MNAAQKTARLEDRRPSLQHQRAAGKALRKKVPREQHAEWREFRGRPDPVDLLIQSNAGRVPGLVPIRHARMLTSPFAFLRGSAGAMACDLSHTPSTGIRVLGCGDCHLLNFGAFGTPERRMIFSITDFDETLPAPWEWDVKRLAASIVVAGRYINLKEKHSRAAAEAAVRWYRRAMANYAGMQPLEVWYDHIDVERVLAHMPSRVRKRLTKGVRKARTRNLAEHDLPKLVTSGRRGPRIKDDPPLILHDGTIRRGKARADTLAALKRYRSTLADPYRVLLDRFSLRDIATKVVGVGSVGRACYLALFMTADDDPLFLQIKQADASVLEPYAGRSLYRNHGQRVVMGQRLMQAASDILLGWTEGGPGGSEFFVRQMRDMKWSVEVETLDAEALEAYAEICGWDLARAHARSGNAGTIAGYLGKSRAFDRAIADFAGAYADQTARDHRAMQAAVRNGRITAAKTGS